MTDLWSQSSASENLMANEWMPLAARMRPQKLEHYAGQLHLLGEDKPLYQALIHGHIHSMILWGPPGTGKTTLAKLITQSADAQMLELSAVTSGVKDIRDAIETAKLAKHTGKRSILFIDEVHRFNKSQQDAFLPSVEDGTIVFIGATTENPAFALNNALLSRVPVYTLKPLDEQAVGHLLDRALDTDTVLSDGNKTLDDNARDLLIQLADGDARKALSLLELAYEFNDDKHITADIINAVSAEKIPLFDNKGDVFYDLLSAFHKSVRGSSVDGSLYWYARILEANGQPLQVARRLLAIATEDIGTADPKAMNIALNAWDIFHRVGAAEGERAIAEAIVYCALAPKSNAVYRAFKSARQAARHSPNAPVPMHLRNAPTAVHKSLGAGEGYRYAHDEEGAYAAGETYLPDELINQSFYSPSDRGFEKQLAAKIAYLKQRDQQSK